jgi:hypothetical protein
MSCLGCEVGLGNTLSINILVSESFNIYGAMKTTFDNNILEQVWNIECLLCSIHFNKQNNLKLKLVVFSNFLVI